MKRDMKGEKESGGSSSATISSSCTLIDCVSVCASVLACARVCMHGTMSAHEFVCMNVCELMCASEFVCVHVHAYVEKLWASLLGIGIHLKSPRRSDPKI